MVLGTRHSAQILSTLGLFFAFSAASYSQQLGDFRNLQAETHREMVTKHDFYPYPGNPNVHILVIRSWTNYCTGSPELEGSGHWSEPFRALYDETIGPVTLLDRNILVSGRNYVRIQESYTRSCYSIGTALEAEEKLAGEQYTITWSPTTGFSLGWAPITLTRNERKYSSWDATFEIVPITWDEPGDPGVGV